MDQKKRMQLAYFGLQELKSTTERSVIHKMEVLLDSRLWQQLPFDLLVKVLSKLPISALMSFSRVCKRWRSLIRSTEFAHQCHSVQPFVFYHSMGDLFPGFPKTCDGEDLRPYLAFPNTKSSAWEKHILEFAELRIALVAADQGLMCFRSTLMRNNLYMYNPLTRRWRELRVPGEMEWQNRDMPRASRMLVGLIVDHETGNYKLVVGLVRMQITADEEPGGTYVYDSLSSAWTRTSDCPDFPVYTLGYEDIVDDDEGTSRHLAKWVPGIATRCGENLYWAVEEASQDQREDFFRILLKYDLKAGRWTVDEPILPYSRLVDFSNVPACLPRSLPYARLVEQSAITVPQTEIHTEITVPQWNFHLAAHNGTMYVTLFDSLVSTEAFSSKFSTSIPEVKVIDADLVRMIGELSDFFKPYLPTKAIAQKEMWYVAFEYEGVCGDKRETTPLYIFAYDTKRQVSRWLPALLPESPCGDLCMQYYPPYGLHRDLNTFAATFKAFV
ncbi:hypothetical protein R1sor_026600 [Riccia sorocarpa]|uniref:F-box domain-containing protein n=1 Tax=Riccia sorocarpa TaxID=122646 RepID=A0ABD3GBU4_9MARC